MEPAEDGARDAPKLWRKASQKRPPRGPADAGRSISRFPTRREERNVGRRRKSQPRGGTANAGLWSSFSRAKVGALPLPLYLATAVVVIGAAYFAKLPGRHDRRLRGHHGARLLSGRGRRPHSSLRQIGGAAILCLFVPSALLGYNILGAPMNNAITAVMKTSNFLYLYIACSVTGPPCSA